MVEFVVDGDAQATWDDQPGVVELVLGTDEIVEQATVIERSPRSFGTVASALVLGGLLLGLLALLVLPGLSDAEPSPGLGNDESTDARTGRSASVGANEVTGGAESVLEDDDPDFVPEESEVRDPWIPPTQPHHDDTDETANPGAPEWPLFPESPGLTLVFRTVDSVVLLNADDGSRRTVVAGPIDREGDRFNGSIERAVQFGSMLVVREGARIVGFSLVDDSTVDYGEGGAFWPSADGQLLHILRGDLWFSEVDDEERVIDTFGTDNKPWGKGVPLTSNRFVYVIGDGLFTSGGAGIYTFEQDSFERLTIGSPWASGSNHVVSHECSDQFDCGLTIVSRKTGEVEPLLLGEHQNAFPVGGTGISPNADHVLLGDERTGDAMLMDVATAKVWELGVTIDSLGGYDGSSGAFWTPDGRYLLVASLGEVRVFDVLDQTVTKLSRADLGLERLNAIEGVLALN